MNWRYWKQKAREIKSDVPWDRDRYAVMVEFEERTRRITAAVDKVDDLPDRPFSTAFTAYRMAGEIAKLRAEKQQDKDRTYLLHEQIEDDQRNR